MDRRNNSGATREGASGKEGHQTTLPGGGAANKEAERSGHGGPNSESSKISNTSGAVTSSPAAAGPSTASGREVASACKPGARNTSGGRAGCSAEASGSGTLEGRSPGVGVGVSLGLFLSGPKKNDANTNIKVMVMMKKVS